jgi:hypothetical protein
MAKIINFAEARIARTECSNAMKDFLRDMRVEFGDQAALDEIALLESAEYEWSDDTAS